MSDAAHEYPRIGTIQNWRCDRGYGEIKDSQTGKCFLAPLARNHGPPFAAGVSLDGTTVRFRIQSSHLPVDWIRETAVLSSKESSARPPIQALNSIALPSVPMRPIIVATPAVSRVSEPQPSSVSQIQSIVNTRSIKQVFHFTRLDNLPGIAKHGLLPREVLSSRGIAFVHNDNDRLDRAVGATCLTVGWPNYKMFFRYRTANPGASWAVLSIEPNVLWNNDCAFCIENAASNRVRAISLVKRKTASAFAAMFDEHPFYPTREELGIPARFPTNPQAEVLLFGRIPLTRIQSVFVHSQDLAVQVRAILRSVQVEVSPGAFGPRMDWESWRSGPTAKDVCSNVF